MAPDPESSTRVCHDPLNATVSVAKYEYVKSLDLKILACINKLIVKEMGTITPDAGEVSSNLRQQVGAKAGYNESVALRLCFT